MVAYCSARYARECETWTIDVTAGEPTAGIRDRLQLWASCNDSSSERWRTIRAVQQSQLRQQVHREPWGLRARCLRLALAVECIDAEDGCAIWQQALAAAALVPTSKARRFKNTLAELANADARSLPLELHDFVWEVLSNGTTPLAERVANAYTTLSSA
jgi:hypothetical protein